MIARFFTDPDIVRPAFRFVAFAEAASWAGLLLGMYMKYLGSGAEWGVTVFGPIHGVLFLVYIVVAIVAWRAFGWGLRVGVLAILAAVPPFTTIVFDLWAERTGRLEEPLGSLNG